MLAMLTEELVKAPAVGPLLHRRLCDYNALCKGSSGGAPAAGPRAAGNIAATGLGAGGAWRSKPTGLKAMPAARHRKNTSLVSHSGNCRGPPPQARCALLFVEAAHQPLPDMVPLEVDPQWLLTGHDAMGV